MHANRSGLHVAAMLGAILCWSSVPLFLKHFTADFDAWTVNGVRYGVAAALLMPAWLAAARGRRRAGGRSIWIAALVPSAVNTVGQVGWAVAPYYIDASFMGFGIRSAFFFTLLGSLLFLPEERPLLRAPAFWLGAALCVAGLGGLFAGSFRGQVSAAGTVILLATAMVWGFYGVSVRAFMREYPSHHSFGVICLYTAAALLVLMAVLGRPDRLPGTPPATVALLVISAVIGIAMAHILMYFSIRRLGPVIMGGAEFMTPFLTFAGAALLFGERLTAPQWLGGCAVIAGSLILLRARRHRFRPPPPVKA